MCFFRPSYPSGIRIDGSGDVPCERNRPSRERGPLPCATGPHHVLSLESNGEFPVARTVGMDDRAVELVCAPLMSAQPVRRRRIRCGGCRAGRTRGVLGRAKRASRRGRSPLEAVLWSVGEGGSYPRRKNSISLNFNFKGEICTENQQAAGRNP